MEAILEAVAYVRGSVQGDGRAYGPSRGRIVVRWCPRARVLQGSFGLRGCEVSALGGMNELKPWGHATFRYLVPVDGV